jgi:hypothetical protein
MVLLGLRDTELPEPGEGDDSVGHTEKTVFYRRGRRGGRTILGGEKMGIAYMINMGAQSATANTLKELHLEEEDHRLC